MKGEGLKGEKHPKKCWNGKRLPQGILVSGLLLFP